MLETVASIQMYRRPEFFMGPQKTEDYWKRSKGYISIDRETLALLAGERASVSKVFHTIVSQAFTYKIPVRQADGTFMEWGAGTRPWSLRGLAAACNVAVNTLYHALKRLAKLNLIRRISTTLGSVVQALRFYQYRKDNPNVGKQLAFDNGPTQLTTRVDTRVSKTDNYRCGSTLIDPLISTSSMKAEKPAENFLEFGTIRNLAKDFLKSLT